MELLAPIVIAIITSVVGPAIVEWVKKRRENKPKDPLGDAIQHNSVIEHQLDLIFKELECDQVYIAQFHNGGHFYPTGKSIQKFSVFYEVLTPGTPSLKTTFQNSVTSTRTHNLGNVFLIGSGIDIGNSSLTAFANGTAGTTTTSNGLFIYTGIGKYGASTAANTQGHLGLAIIANVAWDAPLRRRIEHAAAFSFKIACN